MKRAYVMHPNIEELSSIRDRLVEARWQGHLQHCTECIAKLREIERIRASLRGLPSLDTRVSWSAVQARMNGQGKTRGPSKRTQALIGLAVAASVAMIALLVGLPRNEGAQDPQALAASHHDDGTTTVELASLIDRSRRLDALLQTMPARPQVERVSMAATLDTMEERIQWLDYQLSYAGGELDAAQSQRLWQERVELMDSLVKVRYAQAGTSF